MQTGRFVVVFTAFVVLIACGDSPPEIEPAGREETTTTQALEAGSAVLQDSEPLDAMNVYLVGFHPLKEDPHHQLEAHHFCSQVNEDFAQCVLFDGNTGSANLNGIEYIISERLFETLPEDEKQYWHPHNYEILSGQLIAPGIPDVAEYELMEGKMNSYGKTWHTWKTSDANHQLPLGPPSLAWSFNRDGEARAGLVEQRDQQMGIDTEEVRRKRQPLAELAKPQSGVDVLKGQFEGQTRSIEGVKDKEATAADAEGETERQPKPSERQ